MRRTRARVPLLLGVVFLAAACGGSPILANAPVERGSPPAASATPTTHADPQPIAFPRDDGPHDRLTEWWYYTGHLVTDSGRRFGFEYVIFRAERGAFPVSFAAHLALTDEQGQRFLYDQRSEIGPQVDVSPRAPDGSPTGFALVISGSAGVALPGAPGSSPGSTGSSGSTGAPWLMSGAGGAARLVAARPAAATDPDPAGAVFGLDLGLRTDAPAVLHDRIGFIDFGDAGGSYYYSRPRMAVDGQLLLDGQTFHVTGEGWFDHQWGDFISVGGGGWDWFAVNLADGTDVTLSLVRDASGAYPLVYGTLVHPDGTFQHLDAGEFSVTATGTWTSPATGTTYPAKWQIQIPTAGLEIMLQPTVAGQELDTRPTTGVIYWEGSQHVSATKDGQPVAGEGYVELTGYAKAAVAP